MGGIVACLSFRMLGDLGLMCGCFGDGWGVGEWILDDFVICDGRCYLVNLVIFVGLNGAEIDIGLGNLVWGGFC